VQAPLHFEPNLGQTDASVRYLGRASQGTLWLRPQDVTLGIPLQQRAPKQKLSHRKSEKIARGLAVLRLHFLDSSAHPTMQAEDPQSGVSNYLLGNDPQAWHTGVAQYSRVRYNGIYPGIDAVFYGSDSQLEYDFILKPGATPQQVRLKLEGADSLSLNGQGDLRITIAGHEILQRAPRLYQSRTSSTTVSSKTEIPGHYVLLDRNTVGFEVAAYDHSRDLIIDPVISYATFLGGTLGDVANSIAADPLGAIYVTGFTNSPNFPTTAGLVTAPATGGQNAFIARLNPAGSGSASLLYSTYFGGRSRTAYDDGNAVAVDSNGNAWVVGRTYSSDFPQLSSFQNQLVTTANCGTTNCPDAFVARFSTTGAALLSSYLGGGNYDAALSVAVDASGSAYVAGETTSSNLTPRGSAYQSTLRGFKDAFLAKVSSAGALTYLSYFGGDGGDSANAVEADAGGNFVFAGETSSTNLPVSNNAFRNAAPVTGPNTASGFVARINPNTSGSGGLTYGTYVGGASGNSTVNGIALANSNIYVAGTTDSASFPVSANAVQGQFQGRYAIDTTFTPTGDAFALVLNPSAQGNAQMVYSTFLGGTWNEEARAIAVDSNGRITLAGNTFSFDFPVSDNAIEPRWLAFDQGTAGFLARIDPTRAGLAGLLYSSYVAGNTSDLLWDMVITPTGDQVTVVGQTQSTDAPVTTTAYQAAFGGKDTTQIGDAYVARFDLTSTGPQITQFVNGAGCVCVDTGIAPGLIFTIKGKGLGPTSYATAQLAPDGRLTTTLANVKVLVNGIAAPLLYVQDGQINAVAPFAISSAVGRSVFIQVVYNNVAGNLWGVSVKSAAPAIFPYGAADNHGAILNADSSINSANLPAQQGTSIQIFGTGEGLASPALTDGQFANDYSRLPRPLLNVTVTIGGKPAKVDYAGTTPQSFAGFFQVNAVVPTGLTAGPQPIVITVGTASTPNPGMTVYVK
jgi:uncharacterized protein (TIGR03437 family)